MDEEPDMEVKSGRTDRSCKINHGGIMDEELGRRTHVG